MSISYWDGLNFLFGTASVNETCLRCIFTPPFGLQIICLSCWFEHLFLANTCENHLISFQHFFFLDTVPPVFCKSTCLLVKFKETILLRAPIFWPHHPWFQTDSHVWAFLVVWYSCGLWTSITWYWCLPNWYFTNWYCMLTLFVNHINIINLHFRMVESLHVWLMLQPTIFLSDGISDVAGGRGSIGDRSSVFKQRMPKWWFLRWCE